MKTSVCFALMFILFLPAVCGADTLEWTLFSVEWLADASDAIAIGEIQAIDPNSSRERMYKIAEIVKPHELLSKGEIHRVEGALRDEEGEKTLLFFREEEDWLECYHTVWFQRTSTLAYSMYQMFLQSESRIYFGLNARGVLIETPEELIERIRMRMVVSEELPSGVDRHVQETFNASPNVAPECLVSPRGWEYADSYDIKMYLIVPPDVKERIETERETVPRPATESERESIRIAKRLYERNVSYFALGTEADMPFLGIYAISPMGEYLINSAQGRLDLIDMEYSTGVWEDDLLGTVQYAADETLLTYTVRENGEEIRLVDLKTMSAYPSISPALLDGKPCRLRHYAIDSSGKYIAIHYNRKEPTATPRGDRYLLQVREISSGNVLFELDGMLLQPYTAWRPYKGGDFSPQSNYLVHADHEEYILLNWRSGKASLHIPINAHGVAERPIIAPDERIVAVPYKQRVCVPFNGTFVKLREASVDSCTVSRAHPSGSI